MAETLTPLHDPRDGQLRYAGFMSVSGSNLRKLIDHQRRLEKERGKSPFVIPVIFSNRYDCKAGLVGHDYDLPVVTRDDRGFKNFRGKKLREVREEFDSEIIKALAPYECRMAALGGYMLFASNELLNYFTAMINVHPADLSKVNEKGERKYIGDKAVLDALVAGELELRSTTHLLDDKPDHSATQITQKERYADVGNGLVTLMHVLGDFANDMRMLYSSAIGEVSDRESAERLGGSSADAGKNNPINWENICGKVAVVESGMRVLYEMIHSDFQRDLRGSVQQRYQPGMMMAETYESFVRANKGLKTLSVNEDRMTENLKPVRGNPSEAMVAILRGKGWVHSKHGVGHDFVKVMGRKAKRSARKLIYVCLQDSEFRSLYDNLLERQRHILDGRLELYTGSAHERAERNIAYAREVARK